MLGHNSSLGQRVRHKLAFYNDVLCCFKECIAVQFREFMISSQKLPYCVRSWWAICSASWQVSLPCINVSHMLGRYCEEPRLNVHCQQVIPSTLTTTYRSNRRTNEAYRQSVKQVSTVYYILLLHDRYMAEYCLNCLL